MDSRLRENDEMQGGHSVRPKSYLEYRNSGTPWLGMMSSKEVLRTMRESHYSDNTPTLRTSRNVSPFRRLVEFLEAHTEGEVLP